MDTAVNFGVRVQGGQVGNMGWLERSEEFGESMLGIDPLFLPDVFRLWAPSFQTPLRSG